MHKIMCITQRHMNRSRRSWCTSLHPILNPSGKRNWILVTSFRSTFPFHNYPLMTGAFCSIVFSYLCPKYEKIQHIGTEHTRRPLHAGALRPHRKRGRVDTEEALFHHFTLPTEVGRAVTPKHRWAWVAAISLSTSGVRNCSLNANDTMVNANSFRATAN